MDYTTNWDFPQSSSAFPQLAENDFLAILQQFNADVPSSNAFTIPHDGVDPSKITNLPAPAPPTPLSDESSPSPPSVNDHESTSRRQSTTSTGELEAHELKRKASTDGLEDDSPDQKSSRKGPSRRKSSGKPTQDESRLLKRKEQNRAAQRAFRERKEKHVKDLEDKVAELEAKNITSETENQHLKDLLKRLQDENVAFRNSAFTFTAPRNSEPSDGSFSNTVPSFASSPTSVFASTSHLPSPPSTVAKAPSPQSSSLDTPSAFPGDIDFGSLTPLDASLTLLDDSDAIMSYDFGYGQFVPPTKTPYKTIASNPMFISYADPSTPETALTAKSSAQSPNPNGGNPYDVTFGQWTGQTEGAGSLDELLGGNMNMFGTQAPINFNALMKSSVTSPVTSAMSPVAHQSVPSSSNAPSSGSSPSFESSDGTSPPAVPGSHGDGCPKTRAQMEQHIQAAGSSMFAPPPPRETESPSVPFRAPASAEGPMIICKDATFPKTEQSDKNIEVLAAWKSITSHPSFKGSNVDVNELCSAFADKARCDGTKVVLDPQGVSSILEKLSTRLNPNP